MVQTVIKGIGLQGPLVYNESDMSGGSLGASYDDLEFSPTNQNRRVIAMHVENTHGTQDITILPMVEGGGNRVTVIKALGERTFHLPEGIHTMTMKGSGASTTFTLTAYERVFLEGPSLE